MNNKEKFVFLVSVGTNSFNWEYNCDRTMEAVGKAMDANFHDSYTNSELVQLAREFLAYFYSNGDKNPEWGERLK
jgi:hypothetical protein